jgi:hypothetical protein
LQFAQFQIQVVDGPGDGRRDISSLTANGNLHVTQCKFHADPTRSVNSRETDELPIALLKFGCKSGAFFTTGRASPQAKREYLDGYPGFDLNLCDVDILVDHILNTPVLRLIYLEGKSEKDLKLSAELPIILRLNATDEVVREFFLEDLQHPHFLAQFSFGRTHQARLHPYRPPYENPRLEFYNGKVNCLIATLLGESLYEILEPKTYMTLVQHVAKVSAKPVTIRVGQMELRSLSGSGGRVVLDTKASTFVINQAEIVTSERAWSIFRSNKEWKHPQELRILESSWYGWYGTDANIAILQSAGIPMRHGLSSPAQHMRDLLERQINMSFFLRGNTAKCAQFSEGLGEDLKPNWSCPLGESARLLGWLSPGFMYASDETKTRSFRTDITGFLEIEPSALPDPQIFRQRCQDIKGLSLSSGLDMVASMDALALSRIEGHALVDDPQMYLAETVELVEEFELLPSPFFHLRKDMTFAVVWKVPKDFMTGVGLDEITKGDPAVYAEWSAMGDGFGYLHVSNTKNADPTLSADENVRALEQEIGNWILQLRTTITRVFPEASLVTGKSWGDVIGIRHSTPLSSS